MEPSCPSFTAKKKWKMLRIVFSILQKGVTKSKLFLDDHQDKLIPWEAFNNLTICHPTTTPACGSHDIQDSFISPLHYEFSCSSSPPYRASSKRRSFRHQHKRQYRNKGYTRFHARPMFNTMYDMVAPGSVDAVDDVHWNVDKAAEEFIDSFYKELRLQKMNFYSRS